MNKTFKNKNKIELNSEYYIESDGGKGVCLVYHQMRERKTKTGETENFLFEDRTYYTRLVQSLKAYVDFTENESKDLKELLAKVDYNTELLNRLDKIFKQF